MRNLRHSMVNQRLRTIALLIIIFLLGACGDGSNNNKGSEPSVPVSQSILTPPTPILTEKILASEVTFFNEPANPLMLSYKTENGTNTVLLGQRDEDGVLISVDGMYFDDGSEKLEQLTLDEASRPAVVHLKDGTTLIFSYPDSKNYSILVRKADGTEATVVIDTTTISANKKPASTPLLHSPTGTTLKSHASVVHNPATSSLLTVNVTSELDGMPISGANVWTKMLSKKLASGNGYKLPLRDLGDGRYTTQFMNTPSTIPPNAVQSNCQSIAEGTQKSCVVIAPIASVMAEGGCAILSLHPIFSTTGGGIAFLPLCESGFLQIIFSCAIVETVESKTPEICKAIETVVSIFDPDGMQLTASATKSDVTATVIKDIAGREKNVDLTIKLPTKRLEVCSYVKSDGTSLDGILLQDIPPTIENGQVSLTCWTDNSLSKYSFGESIEITGPDTYNIASSIYTDMSGEPSTEKRNYYRNKVLVRADRHTLTATGKIYGIWYLNPSITSQPFRYISYTIETVTDTGLRTDTVLCRPSGSAPPASALRVSRTIIENGMLLSGGPLPESECPSYEKIDAISPFKPSLMFIFSRSLIAQSAELR